MKRFLLDTGIASDDMNHRRGVFERARQEAAMGHRIGIAISVLAKLHFGIELSASREQNQRKPRHSMAHLIIWPLTEQAAEEYG